MKQFQESFSKAAHDVRLPDAARARMRARLLSHMRENPVSIPSPYRFSLSSFHLSLRGGAALALAVLVVGAGGTAYAAGGALPGDALYAVKVSVNEPVAGVLAVTPAAKAAHQADVATERLAEAQALAEDGRLTASTSASLALAFGEHTRAAADAADALAAEDPVAAADISAGFSASVASRGQAILDAGANAPRDARRAGASFVRSLVAAKSGDLARADDAPAPARPMMKAAMVSQESAGSDASDTGGEGGEDTGMMRAFSATAAVPAAAPVLMIAAAPLEAPADDAALAAAIEGAAAALDGARDTLDAAAAADFDTRLADLKLIPLAVAADDAAGDADAAQADRERGIAAAAALTGAIEAVAAQGS
jgi:hypothetical protein